MRQAQRAYVGIIVQIFQCEISTARTCLHIHRLVFPVRANLIDDYRSLLQDSGYDALDVKVVIDNNGSVLTVGGLGL